MILAQVEESLECAVAAFLAGGGLQVLLEDSTGRVRRTAGKSWGLQDPVECATLRRPLRAYGRELGTLHFRVPSDSPRAAALQIAAEDCTRLLESLARMQLEVDELSSELADSYESINLLYDLSEHASRARSPSEVASAVLRSLNSQVRCRSGSILLPMSGNAEWWVAASFGRRETEGGAERVRPEREWTALLARREPLVLEELPSSWQGVALLEEGRESALYVPMVAADRVLGVALLFDREGGPFSSHDRKLSDTVAGYAAALLRGIQLAEVAKEFEIGQRIQRSLLPRELPRIPGLGLAGHCSMARIVGGDFYDAAIGDDGELRAVIADVSGHDLGAALLMATARALFRSQLRSDAGPAKIVSNMNGLLHEDLTGAGLFLSFFVIQFRPEDGRLLFSAGGHNPLLWLPAQADSVLALPAPGLPAGVTLATSFDECSVQLGPGDLLLLHTDGLTEATSPEGEMFGEDRLGSVLVRHRQRKPEQIVRALESAVTDFRGGEVLADDGTALLLQVGLRESGEESERHSSRLIGAES